MATGRTVARWARIYADGYDLSGYTRSLGQLMQEFDAPSGAALTDEVMGVLLSQAKLGIGAVNGFFDNTATSGLHVVANGAGVKRTLMIPLGVRAAPAQGDPVYCGQFTQGQYLAAPENNGYVLATIPFENSDAVASHLQYTKPWGVLLHPKGSETGANSTTGAGINNGASSALGGYFVYQIFSANGTATVSVDDSADDSNYAALSGATSGSVDASATPLAGIVALAVTATVRQYLRFQVAFGTATTILFASAFVRG